MLSSHNNNSFSSNPPSSSSSSLSSASHDHLVYGSASSASSSLVMVQKVRDVSEDVINSADQFLREALQNPWERLSAVQILTQGKLSAPHILRIQKVINYVVEKMVVDKPLDNMDIDGTFAAGLLVGQLQHPAIGGDGSFWLKPWQKLKPFIEILCNNQIFPSRSLLLVECKRVKIAINFCFCYPRKNHDESFGFLFTLF
ncbi:hypothetical protein ACSBR1_032715 [Camellia fascicularis]